LEKNSTKCLKISKPKTFRIHLRKNSLQVSFWLFNLFSDSDIKEIIKIKQEKPNEVNDELLRQGKWMSKKLLLIKWTSDNLKGIREDNITTILN
jgi:hypothetical protein